MNSKEAVAAVFDGIMPDYIPLGMFAIDADTVEKIIGHETYVRNRFKIQLALWDGRRDEVVQSLKEDSVELFKKLDSTDLIIPFKEGAYLPPKSYQPPKVKKLSDNVYETENGIVYQYSEVTNDLLPVSSPPVDRGIFKNTSFMPPDGSETEACDYLARYFADKKYIAGLSGGINAMVLLDGIENGLMEYYLNPESVKEAIAYYRSCCDFMDDFYIKPFYDGVFMEEDYADSNNTFISPQMFAEFCEDTLIGRVQKVKSYGKNVAFHSCGNTKAIMSSFIKAGISCYQSMQTNADMDIVSLSKQYGDKIRFWGGVSVETLIDGTSDEVRKQVRHAFELVNEGVPFILGPSHSIAYGTKYDNLMAMLDEHDKCKYIKNG